MSWFSRFRNAVFPGRLEGDIEAEIRDHLERRAADLEAQGLSRQEAERRAHAWFGSPARIQEQSRDRRLWPAVESFCQDVRYAWRGIRRAPAFSLAAILSIGVAIGANTAIYSILDAFLFRPLRVPDSRRLVTIPEAFSYPRWIEVSGRAGAAANFALLDEPNRVEANADQAMMQAVSENTFAVVGIPPAAGRLLSTDDDARPVAVLAYDYWQRRLHGDPAAPGKTVSLNGRAYSIVGVAGRGFTGVEPGRPVDVWVPISSGDPGVLTNEGYRPFRVLGRLSADTERAALAARLGLPVDSAATGISNLRATFSRPLWIVAGLATLILLIACANVATMLLARSLARSGEIAVRISLGAGRGRVLRQFLTESLLLAALAGVAGWILARLAAPVLPSVLSLPLDLEARPEVVLFCFAVCGLSAILFGVAPSFLAVRSPAPALRGRNPRAGRYSVALQVTFVCCLVVVGSAFLFTLRNLGAVNAGFDPRGVTVLTLANDLGPSERARQLELVWQIQARVAALPKVQGAATAWMSVFTGAKRLQRIVLPGQAPGSREEVFYRISPGYFPTLRTPLLAGRDFETRDNDDEPVPTVVNRAFARRYFGGESVLGREFRRDDGARHRIVGLAADSHYTDLRSGPEPIAYMPMKPPRAFTLYVRSSFDSASVTQMVRREADALGGGLHVRDATPLEALIGGTIRTERLLAGLGGAFAALGLLLSVIGIYGLLNYSVTRRSREIGIRTALGASRSRLYGMVGKDLAVILTAGLIPGLAGSLLLLRAARSVLFGVGEGDPLVIGAAVGVLAVSALLAAVLPARRIATIDPIAAIRHE
jgi:predicted permease